MIGRNLARRWTTAVLMVLLGLALALGAQAAEPSRYVGLTILHTGDIHGHLFPFDYDALGSVETSVGGAARRASLMRSLKQASTDPVLVMDAGDVFTRGPLWDMKGEPDFEVMNAVPYDIMTLGNSEFRGGRGDEGRKVLAERVRQARFAVVCANVFDKTTGEGVVPPSKVFEFESLRVGVFGLTAQRVAGYEQARDLDVRDAVATARETVAGLRKNCDLVVALTHIGYERDLELAAAVPGIDVIIGGDSHTWLFTPTVAKSRGAGPDWWVGGPVICHAGEWGKVVGKLQLSLRRDDDGRYLVMGYRGELAPVDSSIAPAEDVERIVWRYAKPFYREAGTLAAPVEKKNAPAWVAERMREAAKTDLAVEPVRALENGLPAGAVTYLDIRKMFPFVNEVVTVNATGRQVREFLAQIGEVGLAGGELRGSELMVNGLAPADDDVLTLAVEQFYAMTSPALSDSARAPLGRTTRDIVTDYLKDQPAPKAQ